jgi:hypothetical protein
LECAVASDSTELTCLNSTGRHYLVFKDQKIRAIKHALTNCIAANRPNQYIDSDAVVKNFFNLFSKSIFAAHN